MEQRTNYLYVGLFVLAAIAVTLGFTLWIADSRTPAVSKAYVIYFDRDVSGLTLGSPVRYLGVDVGEVAEMKLTTNQNTRVAVRITIGAETPIDQGTYASLAYQGITGVAFINLAADSGTHPPLEVDDTSGFPIIRTRNVGIAALLAESGNITSQISSVLTRVNEVLDDDNRTSLAQTLANIEELTNALAGEQEELALLPGRLLAAADELQSTLNQVRGMLDQANPDLMAAIEQLRAATDNIASVTEKLDGVLADNQGDLDDFMAGGLGELPGLVAETRITLRDLEKLLSSLRDDPSQIMHRPQQNTVKVDP